ncbi:MAG: hypothetical protein NC117_04170 [Pseudoflavonifractor sp.]|nr:hypothetical protein [Pseudoflavonifractor sp.]
MKIKLHFAITLIAALVITIPSVAADLRKVYLIGSPTNWVEPSSENAALYDNWALIESAPGSNVYQGVFTIPGYGGDEWFRFVTALNGWATEDAVSPNGPTEGLFVRFDRDGEFFGHVLVHNDSWPFVLSDWTTDKVKFSLDLNTKTLIMTTSQAHASDIVIVTTAADRVGGANPVPGNESIYSTLAGPVDGRKYSSDMVYVAPGEFSLNILPAFTDAGWAAPTVCPRVDGNQLLEFNTAGKVTVRGELKDSGEYGYWTYPDWPGGFITITASSISADGKLWNVSFEAPQLVVVNGIYLIGSPNNFMTPSAANHDALAGWLLDKTEDNVYEGIFDIPADDAVQFRFFSQLQGWEQEYSIGSDWEDFSYIDLEFVNGVAHSSANSGALGNWMINNWPGGSLKFNVNLNANTLTVTDMASGLDVAVVPATSLEAEEGGIRVTAVTPTEVSVYSVSGALVKTAQLPAGESHMALPAGFYIVNGHKLIVR